MKIVIFQTGPLFALDDARHHAEALGATLTAKGHAVEVTAIPFSGAVSRLVSDTMAYRLFDLRHRGDVFVGIGPFAYAMKHPNKRVWLSSLYRPFYELWGTPYGPVTWNHGTVSARAYVQAVDRAWLGEAMSVCAASPTVAQQVVEAAGVETRQVCVPLPPPPERGVAYGDYIVAAGPLTDTSRFPLLVESFSETSASARLVIMAFGEAREEREYLEHVVATRGKPHAISVELNAPWDRVRERVARARACVSLAFRASAPDLFCLTAAASAKPLVTLKDCGDVARLVADDGYCAEPERSALAAAIDEVAGDAGEAERLGRRFADRLAAALPGWDDVAAALTA